MNDVVAIDNGEVDVGGNRVSVSGYTVFVLIMLLLWTTSAVCQQSDTGHIQRSIVIGQVVDSFGGKMPSVEISVLRADTGQSIMTPVLSDTQGNFRIVGVPFGGPYTFFARKFGYRPSRGRGIMVTKDTVKLRFVLNPGVVELPPITVKAQRDRYALSADEIGKKMKGHRDLVDLMAWRRPFMFGDPYMCSPLDSLGVPINDEVRIRITRNLVFGPGQAQRKSRPADAIRMWNGIDPLTLNFVRHVYVNGMRVDIPHDPIHTPERMLRSIPMQHVAEVRYTDCWDKTIPIDMQYSLFVTLKPLPKEQADSVYRFILAQAAAAGPVEGRVMSVNRPSRQQWDSLVRSIIGRDPVNDSTAGDSASSSSPTRP